MRTTVTLDDELLKAASDALGTTERSVVLREALKALVARDAAGQFVGIRDANPGASASLQRQPTMTRQQQAAMERAQAIARKYIPPGVSLADELLEERRAEASGA